MGLMTRNVHQADADLADHFTGASSPSFWSKWFGGILTPILVSLYAVKCFVVQEATLHGQNRSEVDLTGEVAVVYGLVWLSVALFLHFHYFWWSLKKLWVLADLGKVIALLGFIGSLGYVVWRVMVQVV